MSSAEAKNDDLVELLVVERRELDEDFGVYIHSEFRLRSDNLWNVISFIAVVEDTDGRRTRYRATTALRHYLFFDQSGQKRGRWVLNLLIRRATLQDVPVGSKVLCDRKWKELIDGTS